MMNGLETVIHPTEGFATRESCTDTSKREGTVRVCLCVCTGGVTVLWCIAHFLGRCD